MIIGLAIFQICLALFLGACGGQETQPLPALPVINQEPSKEPSKDSNTEDKNKTKPEDSKPEKPDTLAATRVADVVIGDAHTCALLESSRVLCWGDDSKGQINLKKARSHSLIDIDATNFEFSSIAAAGNFTCGIVKNDQGINKLNNKAVCWGDLGKNLVPPGIALVDNGLAVSAYNNIPDICYISSPAKLGRCAQETLSGRRYRQGYRYKEKDKDLSDIQLMPPIRMGTNNACATDAKYGGLICWGNNADKKSEPLSKNKAIDIAPLSHFTCIIKSNGRLECNIVKHMPDVPVRKRIVWGEDAKPIDLGGFSFKRIFYAVSEKFTQRDLLKSSDYHACFQSAGENSTPDGKVFKDGTLFCTFPRVAPIYDQYKIAIGPAHVCAISKMRKVHCIRLDHESTRAKVYPENIDDKVPEVIRHKS